MRWSIIVFLTIIGTASSVANAQFSFATLASFTDPGNSGPAAGLVMDAQGNLFGTTIGVGLPFFDGSPSTDGSVFELPSGSNTIFRQISGHFSSGLIAVTRRPSNASLLVWTELVDRTLHVV